MEKHRRLLPGILLCGTVTIAARLLQQVEQAVLGRPYLEALVLAILLGVAIRTLWSPGARWTPGIHFGARTLLEVAVMLLGASISFQAILAVGPGLLFGIAGVVAAAIVASYGIGRAMGLAPRMAALVACGNSICGNSAIAAVAPVIGADGCDVAASIGFTAVFGVVVVLALPLLVPLLALSGMQYGVLAGLTVYAVPQVLAATAPVGVLSTQIGTLVKLVRVLMLGPVVVALSLGGGRLFGTGDAPRPKLNPLHLLPWFVIGFLALAGLRSCGWMPQGAVEPASAAAGFLTIVSMAALGLGVDVRVVARAGGRVTFTVVASLLALGGIGLGLIRVLGIV